MSGFKPVGHHKEKRLTAASVRALKEPGLYGDGNNLYLKIDATGAKRWIQRITIQGKRTDIGLGGLALVSLAEARETALENRKVVRVGGDPIAAKKRSVAIMTFKAAAEKVHELSAPTWRNGKHNQQWLNTLITYVYPVFGDKAVDAVTSADVLTALTPVWNARPATARRVKQRIGAVMKWAMAQGWRTDNPAETITSALPRHDGSKVQHRRALPYADVGTAISVVRNSDAGPVTKLAFEYLVLTAARSVEVREAVWSEVDFNKREWTIPAARMKAKRPHRVPLSDRAVSILHEASAFKRDGNELIFPGTKAGRPLSDMTLSKLMKELNIPAVPHGFRSSFRDWAGESTNHAREVVEMALAHVIQNKAEAAYARSDLFAKRRLIMSDWCDFIATLK